MPTVLQLYLSPVQVDALCRSKPGVKVVGYYHANELLTDLDSQANGKEAGRQDTAAAGASCDAPGNSPAACYVPDRAPVRHQRGNNLFLAQVDNGKLGAFADNASQDVLQVALRITLLGDILVVMPWQRVQLPPPPMGAA